jgi:hypothetical protein
VAYANGREGPRFHQISVPRPGSVDLLAYAMRVVSSPLERFERVWRTQHRTHHVKCGCGIRQGRRRRLT